MGEADAQAWLGMEVSMEKLYAEQFQFWKGLVGRTAEDFTDVKQHLAKHDEYGGLIDDLIIQQQKQDELRKSLEATVSTLAAKLDEVPDQIRDAVDAAMLQMEKKMSELRGRMNEQSSQIVTLEALQITKAKVEKKEKKKKSDFWDKKQNNVMAELRAVGEVAGRIGVIHEHATHGTMEQGALAASTAADSAGLSELPSTAAPVSVASVPDQGAPTEAAPAGGVAPVHAGFATSASGVPAPPMAAEVSETGEFEMPALIPTPPVHHIEYQKHASMKDMRPATPQDAGPPGAAAKQAIQEAEAAIEVAKVSGDTVAVEAAESNLETVRAENPHSSNAMINELLYNMIDDDVESEHDALEAHEAMMHQWIDDTDHVIATQKAQIETMAKALKSQAGQIRETRAQAAKLEEKLPQLYAALEKVKQSLSAIPELEAKIEKLISDLKTEVSNRELGDDGLSSRIDELMDDLEKVKGGSQMVEQALKELAEWRDSFVREQEKQSAENQSVLDELRKQLADDLKKMMDAFKEAEEKMKELAESQAAPEPVNLDGVVDEEMLKSAIDDVTNILQMQMARSASKEELAELEEALRNINTSEGSGESMDALKESLFLIESRIATKVLIMPSKPRILFI
jgi:chromosome segregation ATPase